MAVGFQGVGQCRHIGGRFLYALEFADCRIELATNATEGTGHAVAHFATGGGQRGQGYAAAGPETFNQHAPATACHIRAADDGIKRHEHILAIDGAVHERGTGVVPAADFHAFGIGGNQCAGNTEFFLITEQFFRVIKFEGEPHHRGHRGQGDPALGEVQAHAQHFLAVDLAFADDAGIGNGAGIGTGFRPGKAKAGNLVALGKAGQPAVFLLLGAVFRQ